MERDTRSKGWSLGGVSHRGILATERHSRWGIRLAVMVLAGSLLPSGALAMELSSVHVRFGASAPDEVSFRGDLQMLAQPIEAFPSIRIDIGTFSETIPTSALVQSIRSDGVPRHRYYYRMPSDRARRREAGIKRLVIDLDYRRFSVVAKYLPLKRSTNPLPFRVVAGLFDECVMIPFSERAPLRRILETDPVSGEVTNSYLVNDLNRHSRWTFLHDAPQTPCSIKDFRADRNGFSVNVPTPVRFEARIPGSSVGLVQVFPVDAEFQIVGGPMCDLHDDGANGDDIKGDHVYSCRVELFRDEPTSMRLIAKGFVGGVEVVSPNVDLDVVPQLIEQDAQVFVENVYRARDIWGAKLAELGNTTAARQQTKAEVLALPFVRDVGFNEDSFLIELAVEDRPGILAALPATGNEPRQATLAAGVKSPLLPITLPQTPPAFSLYENLSTHLLAQASSVPASDAVPNTKVLIWAPAFDKFFPNGDITNLLHRYATAECPSFEPRLMRDEQCTLDTVRHFPDYGTLLLATEGFRLGEWIKLDRDFIIDQSPYFATGELIQGIDLVHEFLDLYVRERLASMGVANFPERKSPRLQIAFVEGLGATWGVRPEFITEMRKRYPDSVVYGGWWFSAHNFKMAQSFTSSGARTFFGFTDAVTPAFVRGQMDELFNGMLDGSSAANAFASLATTQDPGSVSVMQMAGDGRSTYSGSEGVLNGGFENSTLKSWEGDGDARVIDRLGPYTQRDGAFMGVISTGFGLADFPGSIGQTTCLPFGRHRLRFDWNFLSEEFRNFCGTEFNDAFVVSVNDTQVFRRDVNELCTTNITKIPNLVFGAGDDVYATGWQSADVDLSQALGGHRTARLRFGVANSGDLRFDTAVLLDRIRFE